MKVLHGTWWELWPPGRDNADGVIIAKGLHRSLSGSM